MDFDDTVVRTHMQSVGYLIASCHSSFHRQLSAAVKPEGLHMGHVVVLASLRTQRLHGAGDMTQARLTQISGIEKSSLVLFLDALENGGWVERRRHPNDRRAYLVHITDAGMERFEKVGQRLFDAEQHALSVLSTSERSQLQSLLARLLVHLEAGGAMETSSGIP